MQKVEQSILAASIKQARVIPYGIDLNLFRSASKQDARTRLGLPQDSIILLFAANRIRDNVFKDYRTLETALAIIAERPQAKGVLLVALGEDSPAEQIGHAELRFVPYQKEPSVVASYYQAADLYLHAARADTFPNAVLEALACGTPVVATAVGGIPEQVKGLKLDGSEELANINRHHMDDATGFLVPPADPQAIAFAVKRLLKNSSLRVRMADNAARDAKERFDLQKEADSYLDWYREVLQTNASFQPTASMPRFLS
jgi:glycosyltransferase involved in cell wall biosynthesis